MAERNGENDPLVEAAEIDAELREVQSFVKVETQHVPTWHSLFDLRRRIAKALGHDDLWCVEHCDTNAPHVDCDCHCGHSTPPAQTGEGA